MSQRLSRSVGRAIAGRQESVEPIAVIGLSGRYAGSEDVGEYWSKLRGGVDSIAEVPLERWDWRAYYRAEGGSGYHTSRWGGFMAGVEEFDPLFFNISPKEARQLDPQERIFLQESWRAVEDAGYTRAGLRGRR